MSESEVIPIPTAKTPVFAQLPEARMDPGVRVTVAIFLICTEGKSAGLEARVAITHRGSVPAITPETLFNAQALAMTQIGQNAPGRWRFMTEPEVDQYIRTHNDPEDIE